MKSISLRIPVVYRRIFYGLLTLSLCSGLIFFALNRWVEIEGEFGPQKHPLQAIFIRIHGAAAFLMLISFGTLLAAHIPYGWKSRRSRKSGIVIFSLVFLQILLGYLLYYLANEFIREYTGYVHIIFGLIIPLALYVHIRQRRKKIPPAAPTPFG
jgi:MFS family permease